MHDTTTASTTLAPAARPQPSAEDLSRLRLNLSNQLEQLVRPLRESLQTIASAVAEEFGLAAGDAPRLLQSRGSTSLSPGRAAVVILALELLPFLTQETLGNLMGLSASRIYKRKRAGIQRAKGDTNYSGKLERLRKRLKERLAGTLAPPPAVEIVNRQ